MRIDKSVFWPATIITLVFGALFYLYPKGSDSVLKKIHAYTTHQLGWFFLLFTVAMFVVCIYWAFSKMGNIVLGGKDEKPSWPTWQWLGMIFTSGTGGSLLYLGAVEWIWITAAPPFGVTPNSPEAMRWASTYGMFHWGPSAWAFYIAAAVPIGYFYYAKKKKNMKMSEYCRPFLGNMSDGLAGHALNFFYIFGLLGGVLTSIALGTPPISSGFAYCLGLPKTNTFIDIFVIFLWTAVPLAILQIGLKKGFTRLSNINLYISFFLILGLLCLGPTAFILNQSCDALGRMIQNFVTMSMTTDAIGQGGFPQDWTVFYMAWWAVYALPYGLFIAKISKGRTIRELVVGGLTAGSLGCMVFYMVLPNFGISLQMNHVVDLVKVLADKGRGGVVIEMLSHMPGGAFTAVIAILLFTATVLIHYITGQSAVGYSLAAASEKSLSGDHDPQKWNMTFWLVLSGAVSLGLYLLNKEALSPLQTVSIITGFPICFCLLALMRSFSIQVKKDFPDGIPLPLKSGGKIYVEDHVDLVKEAAAEAKAEEERDLVGV
jgi:BCCT family betaine/carnitine transporter